MGTLPSPPHAQCAVCMLIRNLYNCCSVGCRQLTLKEAEVLELRSANDVAIQRRQEQAMRRMLNLNLARGVSAWRAMVNERMQLMNATCSLRNPGLARGWRGWLEMVDDLRRLRNAAASWRRAAG